VFLRASTSTACSTPSESRNATRHSFTREGNRIRCFFAALFGIPSHLMGPFVLPQACPPAASSAQEHGFDEMGLDPLVWYPGTVLGVGRHLGGHAVADASD
jgi:hypothetical protein